MAKHAVPSIDQEINDLERRQSELADQRRAILQDLVRLYRRRGARHDEERAADWLEVLRRL